MYIPFEELLSPQQYQIVTTTEGPILCPACPGAGKTHVLTLRTAYLCQKSNIDPSKIVLFTFTKKAAREMKTRIIHYGKWEGLYCGTFHSICLQLLRPFYQLLGFDSHFTVMSQGDSSELLRVIREEAKVQGIFESNYVKVPTSAELLKFYSETRNCCRDMKQDAMQTFPSYPESILWIYKQYRIKKQSMNVVDFDDILFGFQYILETYPKIRANLQKKFQYIMVDEFQDTNRIQNDIVLRLAEQHRNILAVGDEAQSIYKFRGADIHNILNFQQAFPDAQIFNLEENYRSTTKIISVLNLALQPAKEKLEKQMRSVKNSLSEEESPVVWYQSSHEIDQGIDVLAKIRQLHEQYHYDYKDIAVLYRSTFAANFIDMECSRQKVPYQKWGGVKFSEASHILDMLSFFKVLENPSDEISWSRLFRLFPGIGIAKAKHLIDFFRTEKEENPLTLMPRQEGSMLERMSVYQTNTHIQKLGELLLSVEQEVNLETKIDLVWKFYEPFCRKQQKSEEEFQYKSHGIEQLKLLAQSTSSMSNFLDMFLDNDENFTEQDSENFQHEDRITLSTIHSAKGCEWKIVFLVSLVEGILPSSKNLESEEELRLFYVGASRAKTFLFLYSYTLASLNGRVFQVHPSRFLRQILPSIQRRHPRKRERVPW